MTTKQVLNTNPVISKVGYYVPSYYTDRKLTATKKAILAVYRTGSLFNVYRVTFNSETRAIKLYTVAANVPPEAVFLEIEKFVKI